MVYGSNMKKLLLLLTLTVSLFAQVDPLLEESTPAKLKWKAKVSVGQQLEIVTTKGEKVSGIVSTTDPEGVGIMGESGIRRVKFAEMTKEDRERIGYDPEALKAHRSEKAEAQAVNEQAVVNQTNTVLVAVPSQTFNKEERIKELRSKLLLIVKDYSDEKKKEFYKANKGISTMKLNEMYSYDKVSPEKSDILNDLDMRMSEAREIRDQINLIK